MKEIVYFECEKCHRIHYNKENAILCEELHVNKEDLEIYKVIFDASKFPVKILIRCKINGEITEYYKQSLEKFSLIKNNRL